MLGILLHFFLSVLKILYFMSIGDLPVIISCASLALADAGIMMYDLVAAVSLVCNSADFFFKISQGLFFWTVRRVIWPLSKTKLLSEHHILFPHR